MFVFKNYNGEIIDFPSHIHKVGDTIGQRYYGNVEYPDNITGFSYTDYSSGNMRGDFEEEQLGTRAVKVFYLYNVNGSMNGDLSIEINPSNIDMNSKYILYFECINDENTSAFASISNIKFSTSYPYDYTGDIEYKLTKVNNIEEYGLNNNLYQITFTGSNTPRCLYVPINMYPNIIQNQQNFLKVALRKVEYVNKSESTAIVTDTDDGFMTPVDKLDIDSLYDQSFYMKDQLKRILYVRDPNKPIPLIGGALFNKAIKAVASNATTCTFTTTAIPSNKINGATLISNENSESKVYMYLDGTTVYISPERDGDAITAAPISTGMFLGCNKLTTINFNNFDTSNVIMMTNMFSGCTSLVTISGISNFKTSKVTDMYGMFNACARITSLDLSTWDTSNVTTTYGMFNACNTLKTLNISTWNTMKNMNMSRMFNGCANLSSTMTIMNTSITSYVDMFINTSTATTAKFILSYSNTATKTIATKMIATKSSTSNVSLPGIFAATVTNPTWDTWAGGAFYIMTRGMTINLTGDIGTVKYSWNVYKVYLDYNAGQIKTTKVFATKSNNNITIDEFKTIALDSVNIDFWAQVGFNGHNTLAGYVTITNTTSKGSETQTIYVGDTFAKQYLPV